MALATICSGLQTRHQEFENAFTGFIVDHGVREGSDQEAQNVAVELERIGISAKVLKLSWGESDPRSLGNFETAARRLRYRALGTACWDARINNLLVAHHADDQAETVLARILTGHRGVGLQGIKKTAPIAECEGIYGVDASGHHEDAQARAEIAHSDYPTRPSQGMSYEGGGVHIHRPLLPFAKEKLVALCQRDGVQWFEDHTNANKTLALRNTLRYLIKQNLLPAALQRERLLLMAGKLRGKRYEIEREARRLYEKMSITLDFRTGKANVDFQHHPAAVLPDASPQDRYHIKAVLLRRLLLLVSPTTTISLTDLDQAMDLVFPESKPSNAAIYSNASKVQIAGVSIQREAPVDNGRRGFRLSLTRAVPARALIESVTQIPSTCEGGPEGHREPCKWSKWVLWDSRYWVRVSTPPDFPDGASYAIRFLSPSALATLRKSLDEKTPHRRQELGRYLGSVPAPERWTIPAIVAQRNGEERIASLPSLGWSNSMCLAGWTESPNRLSADIRYKHVKFKETRNHILIRPNDDISSKTFRVLKEDRQCYI